MQTIKCDICGEFSISTHKIEASYDYKVRGFALRTRGSYSDESKSVDLCKKCADAIGDRIAELGRKSV